MEPKSIYYIDNSSGGTSKSQKYETTALLTGQNARDIPVSLAKSSDSDSTNDPYCDTLPVYNIDPLHHISSIQQDNTDLNNDSGEKIHWRPW